MITYFFFDSERYDFWLRLLFTEWFDFRDESSNCGKFIIIVVVLVFNVFDVDFYLLFELDLSPLLLLLILDMLFSVELDRDLLFLLVGVP